MYSIFLYAHQFFQHLCHISMSSNSSKNNILNKLTTNSGFTELNITLGSVLIFILYALCRDMLQNISTKVFHVCFLVHQSMPVLALCTPTSTMYTRLIHNYQHLQYGSLIKCPINTINICFIYYSMANVHLYIYLFFHTIYRWKCNPVRIHKC